MDDDKIRGIRRVSANGGESQAVTTVNAAAAQLTNNWPVAMPGRQAILFASQHSTSPSWGDADAEMVSLDTGNRRVVLPKGGVPLHVLPSGHLIVRRNGDVFAVPFDLERGAVHGSQVAVVQDVLFERQSGAGVLDVSDNGTLIYAAGLLREQGRTLTLVGSQPGATTVSLPLRGYFDPRLSPDGHRVVVEIANVGDDVWVGDLQRGTLTRMTFDPGEDETPTWSPDGKWIAYASSRAGQPRTVFRKASDGGGVEEKVWTSPDHVHVEDWSRDGRLLIVGVDNASTHSDVWIVPIDGADKAKPLLQTHFSERDARLSPDGRWIAYESDESGRDEIYVQRFPGLGSKAQVSADGGAQPVWSRDGRSLFYRASGSIMTVQVAGAEAIQLGTPRRLGEDVYANKGGSHTGYDAAPDGRLIFARESANKGATKYLNVIENWMPELLRRVPVR